MRYEGAINSMIAPDAGDPLRGDAAPLPEVPLQPALLGLRGRRVRPEALGVKLAGKNITEITALSISQAYEFFGALELRGAEATIAVELLKEIRSRLKFPARRGAELPHPGAPRAVPLRGRGPAHPPGQPDRQRG